MISLVGARGFEPPTSCSQSRRATRLRHAPIWWSNYHAFVVRASTINQCTRSRLKKSSIPLLILLAKLDKTFSSLSSFSSAGLLM